MYVPVSGAAEEAVGVKGCQGLFSKGGHLAFSPECVGTDSSVTTTSPEAPPLRKVEIP